MDIDSQRRVLVAMSGGVDSSVAALLVKRQGYEAIGATIKMLDSGMAALCGPALDGNERACCSLESAMGARATAARLGMPFYVFNFSGDFRREVIERFVVAYGRAETPNPCVDCNRFVKLGKLFQRAKELGCSHIATGHYAKAEYSAERGRWLLKRGVDPRKDQSYFLYTLTQEQLSMLLLPLGGLTKSQVRGLAAGAGLESAGKPESQDICFVPDGDYAAFIERYTGKSPRPGKIVGTEGQIYGQHRGLIHYTLGQRRGLGLSFPEPMYVCGLDAESNRVTLGRADELMSRRLRAWDVNLIGVETLSEPVQVMAKIRYGQEPQRAVAVMEGGELVVEFEREQRAITPGQAVVMYDGDIVIGGGTIATVEK